jgi:hypothetical protein
MPTYPKLFLPFRFITEILYTSVVPPIPHPSNPPWLDHSNNIQWGGGKAAAAAAAVVVVVGL